MFKDYCTVMISEINSKDGDTVQVGAVIGVITKNDFKKKETKIEKNKNTEKENNVINLEIEKKIKL